MGSEQRALGSLAKGLDRAELDFYLARFRHGRVSAVEWAIGLAIATPAGKSRGRSQRRDGSNRPHEAGRNTQIAAGSFDPARTATTRRARSGANNHGPAPHT